MNDGIGHIGDLKPDPKNARKHNPRNIGMIVDSLQKIGAARSIVVDENNMILAGHGVIEAAAEAGIENVRIIDATGNEIIAVRRSGLTPEQKRKLAYYDNRTAELADWDPLQIATDLDAGLDFEGMFSDLELTDILGDALKDNGDGSEPQIDRVAELQEQWGTQRGQIWELPSKTVKGKCHRLVCGDSTDAGDVARLMGGEKANAVLTDPPYGQNQKGIPNDEPEKAHDLIMRTVKLLPVEDAVIVAFQSPRTFVEWLDATRENGIGFERMLWMYKAAQMVYPWRGWLLTSEAILVSTKGTPDWNDRKPYVHDCYYMSELSGELATELGWHGSVKPIAVVSDIMERICHSGQRVYDPFLGSGTTMVAAEQLGRLCYGMEISAPYTAVCLQRMADMGLEPRLENCE